MDYQNFESLLNSRQQTISLLKAQNEIAKQQIEGLRCELNTSRSQKLDLTKHMNYLEQLNNQINQQLAETRLTCSELNVVVSAQGRKLESITTQLNNQMDNNNSLIQSIEKQSQQLVVSHSKLRIVQSELQMIKSFQSQRQSLKMENNQLKKVLKQERQRVIEKSVQNISLRKQITEKTTRIKQFQLSFQQYDSNIQDQSSSLIEQLKNQIKLKDNRIEQLKKDIRRLQSVISLKNKHLQSRNCYQEALNLSITGEPNESISVQNTVHFINEELKKRSHELKKIKEKYTQVLILEKQCRELIKKYEQMINEKQVKLNLLQEQNNNYRGLNKTLEQKLKKAQKLRIQADGHLVELLWENEALHFLAKQNLGPNFFTKVKQVEKSLRQKKMNNSKTKKDQIYYSTIEELISKNRQLIQLLKSIRQKDMKKNNEMYIIE